MLSLSANAQKCVDFLNINTESATTYGTPIYNEEGILIKIGGFNSSMVTNSEGVDFFGYLDIDLTSSDCDNETLEFDCFCDELAINNDTFRTDNPYLKYPLIKSGYAVDYNPTTNIHTVTGDIDKVVFGDYSNSVELICFTDNCLSVNSKVVSPLNVSVYPNPANGILNINGDFESIEIVSLLGELVITSGNQTKSIDISSLSTGVYFAKINKNGETLITRFVKK